MKLISKHTNGSKAFYFLIIFIAKSKAPHEVSVGEMLT